jgi:hypothetical protein
MKPRYTFSTVAVETRRFDSDLPFVCASKFSRERVTLLGMHNVVFFIFAACTKRAMLLILSNFSYNAFRIPWAFRILL